MSDFEELIKQFSSINLKESVNNSNTNNNDLNLPSDNNLNIMANQFSEFYLRMIPEFDGEPANVGNFLKACDLIMNQFYNAADQNLYLNHFLLNFIQTKLIGQARLVVNTKIINTWQDLRLAIVQNFTDQRDETSLLSELLTFKQKSNEDALTFSNRCRHIEQLLVSNLICNEENIQIRNLKINIYSQQTLKAFLGGLKNPLGMVVRSTSPGSIEDALKFIIEEENYDYRDKMFQKPNNLLKQSQF